jgi:tetratricopeptide (TPR) repeat protein
MAAAFALETPPLHAPKSPSVRLMTKRLPSLSLALVFVFLALSCSKKNDDRFTSVMARGNGYLEQGDATNAIATYALAIQIAPDDLDARLNQANAFLLAGDVSNVLEECHQALALNQNSAAAYYLMGCAFLRASQPTQAVQSFQQSEQIDPAVSALHFQLGMAQAQLGHLDDSIAQFETILRFEPDHASAHYQLGLLYGRVGRAADAAREMQKHQELLAKNPAAPSGPSVFERCKYTQPRIAFTLEQPPLHGIPVHFTDATTAAFAHPADYHGPITVLDYNHDGRNSLFLMEGQAGFRILSNERGHFDPLGELLPAKPGVTFRRCLTGDLNNDRFEDVVALGDQATQVFKFATNGQARDFTAYTGLAAVKARDGLLADLDFTGKLDLLVTKPDGSGLSVFQNLGSFYFKQNTASGLPASLPGAQQAVAEDWENQDVPGVFVSSATHSPTFFPKQRAGAFVATNSPADWPSGAVIATGDLNNDLRPDLIVANDHEIGVVFAGLTNRLTLPASGLHPIGILLVDYDNDGWLDIIAWGNGIRVWRNLGTAGFLDVTADLGLDKIGPVDSLVAADFDGDGDTDLIASTPAGLRFLRNDGGNANRQLKLRLVGNRSNASGLGARVELSAGRWHALRSLHQLPFEIGIGHRDKLDSLKVRWFDLSSSLPDVAVPTNQLTLDELTLPSGSCPYLYAWDGRHFNFVTDILGASPLGLPLSKSRYIEADPEEILALGGDRQFPPTNGQYEIRITEELREVLYLDQAQLLVVDHPSETSVLPTSKLHPGKPFPKHELKTLRKLSSLQHAVRNDGLDVTDLLSQADGKMVAPVRLREPQLRGLAEPFSVTMDFGELPTDRPLFLVLTGWLRFGGGMANIAASLDPNLPFPFPTLEAELPNGSWAKVDVDVGAPAGKTKTILVDIENKLPPGARRLRLSTAFEIYWDSAGLFGKTDASQTRQTILPPSRTDLHWRGFSEFLSLPPSLPLTPDYNRLKSAPPWRRTPSGWCTRYGPVDDLLKKRDDALVLLNGGDELALSFDATRLPPLPQNFTRDIFLYVVGWDKDADFHVGQGWQVTPLPFSSMDDQSYGHLTPPPSLKTNWTTNNTRWIGPVVLESSKK